MRPVNSFVAILAIGVVLVSAGSASAVDPVLTFGFTDLIGDFDAGSLLFTAVDGVETDGDVTRVAPPSTALFDGLGGFFSLEMTISLGIGDPTEMVMGDGILTLTDVDGDTMVSPVSGVWVYNGSANFVGTVADLVITTDDDEFNGTSGVAYLDGLDGMFDGNIMTLAFGNWFTDGLGEFEGFADASTLAQGAVVPEPATLCLLALGALAIASRRRR